MFAFGSETQVSETDADIWYARLVQNSNFTDLL